MSLPGGNRSPYRAPCDGTVLCGNGPRYQHGNADPTVVDVWLYAGMVPDWDTAGNFIPPYTRTVVTNDCTGEVNPACDYYGANECPTGTDCSGNAAAPCVGWIETADPPLCCAYITPNPYNSWGPYPVPNTWYQPQMVTGVTATDGGSGYVAGDLLTVAGGTVSAYVGAGSGAATATVTAVNGSGAITGVTVANPGSYCILNCESQTGGSDSYALPASPNSATGGSGSGATLTLTFGNQTMSFQQCFKYGFKNVQAMRYWHGQPGYFFSEGAINEYQCPTDDAGDMCSYNFYSDVAYTCSQTKYLTLAYDIEYTQTDSYGNPDYEGTGTASGTLTVDSQSGVITPSSLAFDDPNGYIETNLAGRPGITAGPLEWLGWVTSYTNWYFGDTDTISCDSESISISDSFDDSGNASWSIGSDSLSASYTSVFNTIGTDTQDFTLSMSDSELEAFLTVTLFYPFGPNGPNETIVSTFTISVTLSDANTSADVLADMGMLMDQWDMTDDSQYPWRVDGSVSTAPLVSRSEAPANVSPSNAGVPQSDTSWTDPLAPYYDGSIIGSPLAAGYQGWFDYGANVFSLCDTGEDETPGPYQTGYGQSVYEVGSGFNKTGSSGVPLNATQWTNVAEGYGFGAGAWIFYNLNPTWRNCDGVASLGNVLIAQKWAETKMAFPSQNFFRPAGADRFVYDEDFVYGITNIIGSGTGALVTLENTTTCTGLAPGSTGGIWGGPAVGGFYELTAVTSDTVILGTLVYNVPSDWKSATASSTYGTDAAYCFGKLRWQSQSTPLDPPPILGRAQISAIAEYDSMPLVTEITFSAAQTALGMIVSGNDHIDLYDANMTSIASNLAVTRIDDSHFTVPVAVGTLAGTAWIMTHGAPEYYWDDEYCKGDYVYTDWTWWPRQICEANRYNALIASCASTSSSDGMSYGYTCSGCPTDAQTVYEYPFSGFTQTAECVPFTPCAPLVICISPNGEDFPSGNTFGFPTDLQIDELYGSGWQAEIQQVMEDLFFQAPHFPATGPGCASGAFEWLSDDGSCEAPGGADPTIQYYSHPPMVEARITLPSGAPTLPSTPSTCGVDQVVIGWDSPVGIISGDCTPPNTLFPAGFGSEFVPGLGTFVWVFWGNMCACINDAGEFASAYENQVVGCP